MHGLEGGANNPHCVVQARAMAEGAVQARLVQLDREIKGLQPELKAARKAWFDAPPEKVAPAKEIYEKTKAYVNKLLAERGALEAKLVPGEHACACPVFLWLGTTAWLTAWG